MLTNKSDAPYKSWKDFEYQPDRSLEGKYIIIYCKVWMVRYFFNIAERIDYWNTPMETLKKKYQSRCDKSGLFIILIISIRNE